MMPFILNSLTIRGFRLFENLEIMKLGRVNLIVGKNNVGKSSLLEALRLYAARNHSTIWQILQDRDEGMYPTSNGDGVIESRLKAVRHLFHNQQDSLQNPSPIYIGEIGNRATRVQIELKMRASVNSITISSEQTYEDFGEIVPSLIIRPGADNPISDTFDRGVPPGNDKPGIPHVYLSANGLNPLQLEALWGRIALTNKEDQVVQTLQIIEPGIERVGIVNNPDLGMSRIPMVKLKDHEESIPLRSLGEGTNRIFCIALALVNVPNGLLLVDEIESGLHYSVQFALWELVFATAARLKVQVFATTHSNDCIHAFQDAAYRNEEEDGMLIRLENRQGFIVPVPFDKNRLHIATREEIEVR